MFLLSFYLHRLTSKILCLKNATLYCPIVTKYLSRISCIHKRKAVNDVNKILRFNWFKLVTPGRLYSIQSRRICTLNRSIIFCNIYHKSTPLDLKQAVILKAVFLCKSVCVPSLYGNNIRCIPVPRYNFAQKI